MVTLIVCDGPEETKVGTFSVHDTPMVGDELVVPARFGYEKYVVKWRRIDVTGGALKLFVMRRG